MGTAKDEVALAIVHELRSALAIVRGASDVLSHRHIDSERWEQAADLVLGGLERLGAIRAVPIDQWAGWTSTQHPEPPAV